MRRNFLIVICILIFGINSNAQTLKVAHKSHSGTAETFFVASEKNFGLPEHIFEKEIETQNFELKRQIELLQNKPLTTKKIQFITPSVTPSKPLIEPFKANTVPSSKQEKTNTSSYFHKNSSYINKEKIAKNTNEKSFVKASISTNKLSSTHILWIGLLISIAIAGFFPFKR